MSALISILAFAISAQAAPLQPVTLAGRIIQPTLPTWIPNRDPALSNGAIVVGERVVASEASTRWEPFAVTAPNPANALNWPVEIVVFDRTDLIRRDNYTWHRRADFFTEDLRDLEREVALFVNMVRIASGGALRVQPTWTFNEDVYFGNEADLMDRAMLEGYLRPRVPNGHRSVLFVHPAQVDRELLGVTNDLPYASLAYYRHADHARPGQTARALYTAWLATFTHHLRQEGFQVPASVAWPIGSPLSDGGGIPIPNLAQIVPRSFLEPGSYGDRLPTPEAAPQSWDAVKHNVWTALPRWTASKLTDVPQAAAPGIQPVGNYSLVPLSLGDWMVSNSDAKVAATIELWGRTYLVFDGPPRANLPVAPSKPNLDPEIYPALSFNFAPGQAEKLGRRGGFTAKTVGDADRGSVAEIQEVSARRSGALRTVGAFDPAEKKYLEFWIKPRSTVWPVELYFETGNNEGGAVRLFGTTVDENARGEHVPWLAVRSEPAWQKVVIEIGKHVSKRVRAVYLRPPGGKPDFSPSGLPTLLMDDFELRETASADVTPFVAPPKPITPAADSTLADDRARFIAQAGDADRGPVEKLLADASDLVRLNALTYFAERPMSRPPVAAIVPLASHFNSRIAMVACDLLRRDGSAEAIAGLRRATQFGLSEFSKGMAAQAMPTVNERSIMADLTVLLHMKSPWVRGRAVEALSRQSFREADLVLLSFLNDVEPSVRYEVVSRIRLEQDAVLARLQEVARMDASEPVRGAAFARLLNTKVGASQIDLIAADPRTGVRYLALTGAESSTNQRTLAVRLANDADPDVAATALDILREQHAAAIPSDLKVSSPHPRVVYAWLRLAESAKMTVPAQVLTEASQSRWEDLAKLARKLITPGPISDVR